MIDLVDVIFCRNIVIGTFSLVCIVQIVIKNEDIVWKLVALKVVAFLGLWIILWILFVPKFYCLKQWNCETRKR